MQLSFFLLWNNRLYLGLLNLNFRTSVLLNLMFNNLQQIKLPLSVSDLVLHAESIAKFFGLIAFVNVNLFRLWLLLHANTNHKF